MATLEKHTRKNLIAGGIFIAIAASFAVQGLRYEFGTATQMGPGFFPVVLAFVLGALGVVIGLDGLRSEPEPTDGSVPWRGLVLICLALAIFAAGARDLGLVPVVLLCTFMTALASRRNSLVSAAMMAAVIATLCYLVFKVGLAVAIPTFGPVFGL
ncbi:tripartite tricarboxylate transporter TctB family protein [Agrobacterium vitis]|jgi:putative tricarboxylic transport membrane protein|uniref:Tripartite tricarboxylate transporter TctB family protein n=1 Tax=Agrobacterium vitis TaxID=373 RepID=A0A1S2DP82_AGRVI|nr:MULTISPECIES: tripartite tricarboxylate transporter TctB family protein [Rhizobium/Agrobacterium group]EJC64497.1 Tripartite tricarboxylate transporter TctB family [Rhizobium leguminosarum bv. viciae WSM1455]MCF1502075.1 tripartite tricarboxylate transporter TctB family protein [Allorhizobium sp. Av2]MCF1450479.1 tripartite tricarboxylate transporter TctB family protein [Allorhizobium ampelinum]MCF1455953.1 tripartite tricarboxylate transporter TctB family protein [Agrobacterium vitis]MCF14